MDTLSFVIGHNKGYKQGRAKGGFLSMEENEAGGMTYELAGTESNKLRYNIAYGDAIPTDTNKLWVKIAEPSEIEITPFAEYEVVGGATETISKLSYSFPVAKNSAGASAVDNCIYVVGGNGGNYTNTIYKYDVTNETIVVCQPMLEDKVTGPSCCAVGKNVYIFGGAISINDGDGTDKIYRFDTSTETLTKLDACLPTPSCFQACVPVDTKIYLLGGANGSISGTISNGIYCFDTVTESIETLSAVLPTPVFYMAYGVVENNIYLLGGYNTTSISSKGIYRFNVLTHTVDTMSATLPVATNGSAFCTYGQYIYTLGGWQSGLISTIYKYDTKTDTVTTLSIKLPDALMAMACATIGGTTYLIGGAGGTNGGTKYDSIVIFTGGFERVKLAEGKVQIVQSLSKNIMTLFNQEATNVKMGVDAVYKGNSDNIGEPVEAYLYKNNEWTLI